MTPERAIQIRLAQQDAERAHAQVAYFPPAERPSIARLVRSTLTDDARRWFDATH